MAGSIALIILLGLSGDYLFRRMKLPGLVGMLIVGILIGPYLLEHLLMKLGYRPCEDVRHTDAFQQSGRKDTGGDLIAYGDNGYVHVVKRRVGKTVHVGGIEKYCLGGDVFDPVDKRRVIIDRDDPPAAAGRRLEHTRCEIAPEKPVHGRPDVPDGWPPRAMQNLG